MTDVMRVLIVDDEPHARAGMRVLLEQLGDMRVVGEAEDGAGAVAAIASLAPDLVLLDVQMPGMSGLDVAAALGGNANLPLIVFITAFDKFAVDAFEIDALDYIVKPFSDARFHQMLDRARETVRSRHVRELGDRLLKLAERAGLVRDLTDTAPKYLERITYRDDGRTVVVPLEDVVWIEAASYYARVHTGGRSFLLRESLNTLADRLDPLLFMRVHRSAIVRLGAITELSSDEGGVFARADNGARVPVTKTNVSPLRKALKTVSSA